MKELEKKLDSLLVVNEYPVFREYKDYLRTRAIQHATTEYALYRRQLAKAKEQLGLQQNRVCPNSPPRVLPLSNMHKQNAAGEHPMLQSEPTDRSESCPVGSLFRT